MLSWKLRIHQAYSYLLFNIIVLFSVTTLLLLETPYYYKDLIGIMLLILFLVPPFAGIQEKNTSNESHG